MDELTEQWRCQRERGITGAFYWRTATPRPRTAAGTSARTYEAAVLRTLGATRQSILVSFALRAALLGLCAGLVALAAGIAGGWAVSAFVMETDFTVIWPSAFAIIIGGVLATLLAGLAFAWGPINARPAQVLRARE